MINSKRGAETFEAIVLGRAYNVCPRYPEGTRWEVYARGRFGSCGWNMLTFGDALSYLRDQYLNEVAKTKRRRTPGDEYCASEFRGWIDGPGGRIEWSEIEALVKGRTR